MTADPEAVRPRLRPGVAVTPLREGLHLRGRDTSLTLEGSRSLPALWQVLAARLGPDADAGREPDAGPDADAGREPDAGPDADAAVGPKLAAALATVTARLREHGLLVDHPDGARLPPWPGSVADDPGGAAAALAAAHPVVAAADPDGPLARAVVRALARGGTRAPAVVAELGLPAGRVVATADDPAARTVAVAVQSGADGGFVTEPADPARARTDATAVATRLGHDPGTEPPAALLALLAAAGAQRLLCAVAGLPDPGEPADDPRLLAGRPAVLIAEARPPRAQHHPWAAAPGAVAAPPGDLAEALRRVNALGDPRLGVLDVPSPGDLPQVPVALVSCGSPSGLLAAGAARTDLARLAAACRSAELHLAALGGGAVPVVGADPGHALGRALRRAVLGTPVRGERVVPESAWRDHPQAGHWCGALARRLGRTPDPVVRQLSSAQVYLARVEGVRAVEATPADAVAHAALAALTRLLARDGGLAAAHHAAPSGAAAPLAAAGRTPAAWADPGWTDRWLTEVAAREADLHAVLVRLTGLRTTRWQPATPEARLYADALDGCGFTVFVAEEGRP
ncbi:hypothetical protein ACIRRH_28015 [Kitasatospora sp. NPDC101235]|uniref:hypothetical protein n=1 Tax=Kitasatospora sp. NPDC101235 TaxID=3364101 RepID=UPI0038266E91